MKRIGLTVCLSFLASGFIAGAPVWYEPAEPHSALIKLVTIETPAKPLAMDEAARDYSPGRTRWLRVEEPVGNLPYEDRVGRVHIAGTDGFARTVVFKNFKSFRVRWINEKLLYLQVWPGRVLATEHVFDLESNKAIYQEVSLH